MYTPSNSPENILFRDETWCLENKFGVITLIENGRVWRLNHRLINDRFGRGFAFCEKIKARGYVDLNHWTWTNRRELAVKWGVAA